MSNFQDGRYLSRESVIFWEDVNEKWFISLYEEIYTPKKILKKAKTTNQIGWQFWATFSGKFKKNLFLHGPVREKSLGYFLTM